MRLTNHLRDCFIRAVGDDLPKPVSPTGAAVQAALYELFTPAQKAAFDDPGVCNYLTKDYFAYSAGGVNRYAYIVSFGNPRDELPIMKEFVEASNKRSAILGSLRGVAYGVTTIKALKEALPELVKYMADEEKKPTPGLPVVANLYKDLQALGLKS